MHISVVIPALDEADRIETAIQSSNALEVEVLVVDGGSRDGTPERARRAGARVIKSPAGRARQMAVGFESARGEIVLFLHADTLLPDGFEKAVREAMSDPGCMGGAFAFRFDETSPGLRFVEWGVRRRVRLAGLPYGDQAIFARRTALEKIGGVPQVPIMEDLDLVRALQGVGGFTQLALPVNTSARRYRTRGVLRTWGRNAVALLAWRLGLDRTRIAAWYRR